MADAEQTMIRALFNSGKNTPVRNAEYDEDGNKNYELYKNAISVHLQNQSNDVYRLTQETASIRDARDLRLAPLQEALNAAITKDRIYRDEKVSQFYALQLEKEKKNPRMIAALKEAILDAYLIAGIPCPKDKLPFKCELTPTPTPAITTTTSVTPVAAR